MKSSSVIALSVMTFWVFFAVSEGKPPLLFWFVLLSKMVTALSALLSCTVIYLHFVTLCISNLHAGMSLRSLGMELHCRCIQTESRPIGCHIEKVELIPANSHCEETEIIATLKKTGQQVCLDPEAPWVKKVIERIMAK
uniref:Interleukin-8-like n=1 Tax=Fundulus heteroclitus TaxID=8078 RepID=A0A3Q2P9Q1_FUNHE